MFVRTYMTPDPVTIKTIDADQTMLVQLLEGTQVEIIKNNSSIAPYETRLFS